MKRIASLQHTAGFTLMELQVALLLIAMMAVLMVGALRLGAQTWHKTTARQDVAEHRFLVAQLLRKQLNAARFIRVRTTDGQLISSFLGNARQLHFIAPYPTFKNDNSLYWWTLTSRWNPQRETDELVFDYRPFSPEQVVEAQPDGSLLVETAQNEDGNPLTAYEPVVPQSLPIADYFKVVSAEFFTRDAQGVEEWLDDWPPLNQTPLVIRLELAEIDADGNETLLPEIAVAPRFANQQLYGAEN